jgi:hypothetical protein
VAEKACRLYVSSSKNISPTSFGVVVSAIVECESFREKLRRPLKLDSSIV